MVRYVLESMNAWDETSEAGWGPTVALPVMEFAETAEPDSSRNVVVEWSAEAATPPAEEVIPCRVVELTDKGEAVCWMVAGGHEIPRVTFPGWVLRGKRLRAGSRFNWIVRHPERVRLADIDTNVPQTDDMTPEARARLEVLYDEFQRGLAEDEGEWPVYTGDGK